MHRKVKRADGLSFRQFLSSLRKEAIKSNELGYEFSETIKAEHRNTFCSYDIAEISFMTHMNVHDALCRIAEECFGGEDGFNDATY